MSCVLLVDADTSARGSLALVLRELGREVRVASDAARALEIASTSSPDLVVLAASDAIEIARALRARLGARSPRILLVAGSDVRRIALTHVDDIVRRPFRAAELLARARRLLRASGVDHAVPSARRASGP